MLEMAMKAALDGTYNTDLALSLAAGEYEGQNRIKKCVTILNFVCWPETMVDNRNELSRPIEAEIVEKLSHTQSVDSNYQPFGDGHSSEKIVRALETCKI